MPDPIKDIREGVGEMFNKSPAPLILNATAAIGGKAQELYGKAKDMVTKAMTKTPAPDAPRDIVLPKEPKKGRSLVSRRR